MASPRPSEDEVPRCSERQKLLKNRPRRLRLPASNHNNYNYGEPSPSTPCSVFSFDLPNSPAVLTTPRVRIQRALSQPAELIPASPHSIFNFDLPFEFGSQKTLRSSLSTPQTPITPGIKSPPFLTLPTIAEARGSFSSTVDREEATEQLLPCTTDWKSIRLIMIVILFTRIQFTTYFASLFPFMREVDSSASEYFYSFISVAYSIGIAGAAPLFGRWSNKLGCIRKPSIFSMYLMLATNLMYMFLHLFPFEAKWAMLVARFLAGIAAGGNALLPTYWTYAAAEQDRSSAAALFDGAFCLGLAFGPGFQLLFAPLGYPGFNIGPVTVNMYTVPAMVSILLIIITLILMIFHFNEVPMPKKEAKRGSIDSTSSSEASTGPILPPYDKLAVFICIFGKMIQMFVYACMETIGPMYTQRMFELDLSTTTKFSSMLVSLSGLLGFLFLLTYVWTKTGKKVDNRLGVIVGILVCIGFVLSTFPWSFYNNYINAEGCPETWSCYSRTPAIPQWLYAVAYTVVFGVGFALMNVHLAALYSSVLGPRRQGTMHGINTLLASLSRVLGPLAITDLYKHLGPIYVWIFQLSTWILLLLAFLVFYRRLTPCVPIQPPSAKTAETSK